MKIYSDTLNRNDLLNAVPRGCTLDLAPIAHARVRRYGWTARMLRPGGTRWTNTGQYGAGNERAASYDDHGVWMAALYALDPNARISWWKNADDFHAGTEGKYAMAVAS